MKKILFILFCLCLDDNSLAQNSFYESTFGSLQTDRLSVLLQHPDGSLYLCGATDSIPSQGSDIALHKANPDGTILWSKFFGSTGFEYGMGLTFCHDGNLVMAAEAQNNDLDVLLIKVDTAGNVIWQQFYGGPKNQSAYSVIKTSDHGFLVTGFATDFYNSNDAYLLKVDSTGAFEWDLYAGGSDNDYGKKSVELPDGDFIFTADSRSYGEGGYDVYVVKVDSDGNTIWDKTFGDSLDNGCQGLYLLSDGNLLVYGETVPPTSPMFDFILLKFDSDGNEIWRRIPPSLTGADALFSVAESPQGELVFTGYSNVNGTPNDLVVYKTDQNGYPIWLNRYGSPGIDLGYDIVLSNDQKGFFIAGVHAQNNTDNYLLYIPDSIMVGVKESIEDARKDPFVYPQPARKGQTFNIVSPFDKSDYQIVDLNGKLLLSGSTGSHTFKIAVNQLPASGYYLMSIQSEDGNATVPLIVAE